MAQTSTRAALTLRLPLGLLAAGLVIGLSGTAQAAAAPRPSGYAINVQDEVMMQNLTCEDISRFLTKPIEVSMFDVAAAILNQPQHSRDTSDTLMGRELTALILTASGNPPVNHIPGIPSGICTRIVPLLSPPDPKGCHGGSGTLQLRDLSMSANNAPSIRSGELHLLGRFDHAVKLRNCRGV